MAKPSGTLYDRTIASLGLVVASVAWIFPRPAPAPKVVVPNYLESSEEAGEHARRGPGTLRAMLLRLLRELMSQLKNEQNFTELLDEFAVTLRDLRLSPQYAEADDLEREDFEYVVRGVEQLRTGQRTRFQVRFLIEQLEIAVMRHASGDSAKPAKLPWYAQALLNR